MSSPMQSLVWQLFVLGACLALPACDQDSGSSKRNKDDKSADGSNSKEKSEDEKAKDADETTDEEAVDVIDGSDSGGGSGIDFMQIMADLLAMMPASGGTEGTDIKALTDELKKLAGGENLKPDAVQAAIDGLPGGGAAFDASKLGELLKVLGLDPKKPAATKPADTNPSDTTDAADTPAGDAGGAGDDQEGNEDDNEDDD